MDWQRSILIVLLAVVSYTMILKWNEDFGKPATAQTENASPQNYPQDTPNVVQNPELPVVAPQGTTPTAKLVASHPTLINVDTDVFAVQINTLGGDVVSARLKDFPVAVDKPDQAFTLLADNAQHVYVAQSGLVGKDGPDGRPEGRPVYSSDKASWTLEGDTLVVPLTFTASNGTSFRKEFTFHRGSHLITTTITVNNTSSQDWSGNYYAQIKRDKTPDPSVQGSTGFGLPTFLGIAYWTAEKPFNKYSFSDMDSHALDQKGVTGGWLAMIQHYFLSAWIPENGSYDYSTAVVRDQYIGRLVGQATIVPAGQSHSFQASLYVGPKHQQALEDAAPGKGLHLALDYGPLFFISKILISLMKFYHSLTSNWGVAIILLTVTVKAIFFYPSAKSYQSMAKMRKVQPELLRIREQYADDRQRLSQEMMKLYKDNSINPLGGCLPILIQMPVFLALYWGLLESVELRQAPFFGWIHDLSVMDPLFILPLIMGVTMYVQQMLNPAPPDPTQARVLKFMPVIFTVMFLWFPAGLVVYWITNNTLSILQQWLITRKIEGNSAS